MEFRDLKTQYQKIEKEVNESVTRVMKNANFIMGSEVFELEKQLADYVNARHCISCGNGTDALELALMVWNVGENDAVFVPDFTFFSSVEVVSHVGAMPIFVDVDKDTYNIDVCKLEKEILRVKKEGKYNPKVIVAVDLFGLPADYQKLRELAKTYNLLILEDAAQGFGGAILKNNTWERACSFGDISTTSFFPAKPLGCYGDGGAIFTNNYEWSQKLKSLRIHGKGNNKYENVMIGMNSRLDTLQASILLIKLKLFKEYELEHVNKVAQWYQEELQNNSYIKIPHVKKGFYSSWAQYTIQFENGKIREGAKKRLLEAGIPSMIYYPKTMHEQTAFCIDKRYYDENCNISFQLSQSILSLPMHPYMKYKDVKKVSKVLNEK